MAGGQRRRVGADGNLEIKVDAGATKGQDGVMGNQSTDAKAGGSQLPKLGLFARRAPRVTVGGRFTSTIGPLAQKIINAVAPAGCGSQVDINN